MKAKEPKEKKSVDLVVSENIECLAIAIAMALILKFFIIEAYKIPSGSMQPTILGNDDTRIYDRVLVNKFIYLFEDPERWSVIVFKFPLNRSQNYIKRLIGLPGENVTIKNGDIFIDDRIARKPNKVLGSVLKQVYPSGKPGDNLESRFHFEGVEPGFALAAGGNTLPEDGITLPAGGRAVMANIRDGYLDGYDPDWGIPYPPRAPPIEEHHNVGDLKISYTVTLEPGAEGVAVEIRENGRVHALFLAARGGAEPSFIETRDAGRSSGGERDWSSHEAAIEPGRAHDIAFANIDDRVVFMLDGDEIAAYEYETDGIESGAAPNAVSFGPVGGAGVFSEVAVHRDIYYLPEPNRDVSDYHVPENHYFVLGDNTQNSSDSRRWQAITLVLNNGRELTGEYPTNEFSLIPAGDRPFLFIDDNGDAHAISRQLLAAEPPRIEDRHFVHDKYLLGKAMAVFWPIYPHFRWKLIR